MSARKIVKRPDEPVTIYEYARQSGMSESAIRGRIRNGHWVVGVHFWRKGKGKRARIMLDLEAIKQWWASQ